MRSLRFETCEFRLLLAVDILTELPVVDGKTVQDPVFETYRVGHRGSHDVDMEVFGEHLYFAAGGTVYRSDGSAAGTTEYFQVPRLEADSIPRVDEMISVGDHMFVFVTHRLVGKYELFVTSGEEQPTRLWTAEAASSVSPYRYQSPFVSYEFEGRLLFGFLGFGIENQIWETDGTQEGTTLVEAFHSGEAELVPVGNQLVYIGNPRNPELWAVDQDGEPHLFASFGSTWSLAGAANDQLYFVVGRHIWTTDGTAPGTHPVHAFDGLLDDVVVVGDEIYVETTVDGSHFVYRLGEEVTLVSEFQPENSEELIDVVLVSHDDQLYMWDGSYRGSRLVLNSLQLLADNTDPRVLVDFSEGEYLRIRPEVQVGNITRIGQDVFFAVSHLEHGNELWRTNLGSGLRTIVGDREEGKRILSPSRITEFKTDVFFSAYNDEDGQELHRYEITPLLPDFDENQVVDFADFLILSRNFGREDADFETGDANGDRVVNFADFLLLAELFAFSPRPK